MMLSHPALRPLGEIRHGGEDLGFFLRKDNPPMVASEERRLIQINSVIRHWSQ
jgi:hypothetical protein